MSYSCSDSEELRRRLRAGDTDALADLFLRHRERLWQAVHFRLDKRLFSRVDADDVLQEAYVDAADRISHYIDDRSQSVFVWLRMIVQQTLINVHRRHLGAEMRDAKREVSLPKPSLTQSTSVALQLLGHLTSPSEAAMREELVEMLEGAINCLGAIDREILVLRHFEQLTNSEVAEELGIQPNTASLRYTRALKRLRRIVSDSPTSFEN